MDSSNTFDVIVVGAGPAGSTAARVTAESGLRTLLIDRSEFPRYKTCGGGLIGPSLGSLPPGTVLPAQHEVFSTTFTRTGERERRWESSEPVLTLIDRLNFDDMLLRLAAEHGVETVTGVLVTSVIDDGEFATIKTDHGDYRSRYLIGADGSASRLGKYVGVSMARVDLGLEVELDSQAVSSDWAGHIHLDWGPIPGSYAWVFPKQGTLTVGVIARKGMPTETRKYLVDFLAQRGLSELPVLRQSGHLTRCRTLTSPLGKGRVLLVGDAAGLLEPWTREGISFAIRSGRIAGSVVDRVIRGAGVGLSHDAQRTYAEEIDRTLGSEMRAGFICLRLFEKYPSVVHALMTRSSFGWQQFCKITRGDVTLATMVQNRPARHVLQSVLARL
jgi:geranylgeranyl reductase family protein